MKQFTADFETATWLEDETYVWAWAVCEIGNVDNIQIGNNIDDFIEFCKQEKNAIFHFHNLKFDGEFLIYWAFTHGFKHVLSRKEAEDNTFTTLISDFGQFYSITFYYKIGNKKVWKTTFFDSLKVIPFPVGDIPKYFNLPFQKLEIDYNMPRPLGWRLTQAERYYIQNDVKIVAVALKMMFDEGLTKMTRASNALSDFKNIITLKRFNHYFTPLDRGLDEILRHSYKGGFVYVNPIYTEKDVSDGVVLDVNGLYSAVMRYEKMPYR